MSRMRVVSLALAMIMAVSLVSSFACGGEGAVEEPTPTPVATPTPSLDNPEWSYYQSGNISSGGSCGSLADYPVRLVLHFGPGTSEGENVYLNYSCRDDFGDVRFTGLDGETLLSYWFQEVTPQARAVAWINFSQIQESDTGFYIYYGNLDATSASDGHSTFMIYNDGSSMEGCLEYPVSYYDFDWKVVQHGGNKVLRCTSVDSGGWSNLYYHLPMASDTYVAECRTRIQEGSTGKNYQTGIGYSVDNPMAKWLDHVDYDCWQLRDREGDTLSEPDHTFDASRWHTLSFVKDGKLWQLYVDGDLKVTRHAGTETQYIGMYANLPSKNLWVEFDDFRVRPYCSPEPAFGKWGEPYLLGEPIVRPTPVATATPDWTPAPLCTETPVELPEATATAVATATAEAAWTPEFQIPPPMLP